MSKHEKLLAKLIKAQKTFLWSDLVTVLKGLGYSEVQGEGSRVKFDDGNADNLINLHKPHPGNEMKAYAVKQVKQKLKDAGYL